MQAHACYPRLQKVEAGRSGDQGQSQWHSYFQARLSYKRPCFKRGREAARKAAEASLNQGGGLPTASDPLLPHPLLHGTASPAIVHSSLTEHSHVGIQNVTELIYAHSGSSPFKFRLSRVLTLRAAALSETELVAVLRRACPARGTGGLFNVLPSPPPQSRQFVCQKPEDFRPVARHM